MIQNLYYLSGAASQSLSFAPGGGAVTQTWDVDNLVVCSSLYQIMAFSSSTLVASFPIEGTNLFNGYASSSYITGGIEISTGSVLPTPVLLPAFAQNPVNITTPVVQTNYNFITNVVSSSFKMLSVASASIGQDYATASITLASAFVDQTEARLGYDGFIYRFIAEADPLNEDQPPYLYFFSTGSTATATATNLATVINRALSGSQASSSIDIVYASGSSAALILSGSNSGSYANGITLSTGSANDFSLQGTMGGGSDIVISQTASYVDLSTGGSGLIYFDSGNEVTVQVTGSNDGGLFYTNNLSIYNYSTLTSIYDTSSANTNLSASFTALGITYYIDVTATVQDIPYIQLTYSTASGIPVTPTSSLEGWNSYLGVTASLVINSGSTVYVIGEGISNMPQLIITSSYSLTELKTYKATSLSDLYVYDPTEIGFIPLTSFPSISGSSGIINVVVNSTAITSSAIPYLANTQLETFDFNNNALSGSIQDILNVLPTQSIQTIDISYNYLTGSVPVLSSSVNLINFSCSYNQLAGELSSFSGCLSLTEFHCDNNALTGSITGFEDLISIQTFDCSYNNLTGSVPSLNNNYALTTFKASNNSFTDYTSGSVQSLLSYVDLYQNNLSQSAIEGIVKDIYNAGATNGYLNLSGSGNSVASLTTFQTASLLEVDRGWEVYLNGTPVTYSFNADFLVFTYQFDSSSGGIDLDTRTRIVSPIGTKYHGYDCYDSTPAFNFALTVPPNIGLTTTQSTVPYFYWSGDNTGSGVESCYVDLSSSFGSNDVIQVECRAFWFDSITFGSMSLDIEAYQGGYMSQSGFQFSNVGGTQTAAITIPKVVTTLNGTGSEFGELIGNVYYDKMSNILTFV